MAKSKAKMKKGKKPGSKVGSVEAARGLKKAPASKGDVTGHVSPPWTTWYSCWCDGAGNWVAPNSLYFYCWRDYCLNRC